MSELSWKSLRRNGITPIASFNALRCPFDRFASKSLPRSLRIHFKLMDRYPPTTRIGAQKPQEKRCYPRVLVWSPL